MRRTVLAVLLAAVAAAARVPFLLSHKFPFDSDEAVEGLMALHVLQGELPIFLWGQPYKGVPEAYLAAAVFAVFGPSVTALKSVTLAIFACFVGVQFVVIDRWLSRFAAVSVSLLLIAGPPALVFWSLSASAEYVWIMLLGTLMVWLAARWTEFRSRALAHVFALLAGAALWIHQIILYYLVPLAIVVGMPAVVRHRRRPAGAVSTLFAALSVTYAALAAVAFLSNGVSVEAGPVTITLRNPQKMLRVAAVLAGVAVIWSLVAPLARLRSVVEVLGGWKWAIVSFLIGFSPAVIYSLSVEPARSPARSARLEHLATATPDIVFNIVPIILGFKIATTERLPIPAVAALPGIAALCAFVWSRRRTLATYATLRPAAPVVVRDFYLIFLLFIPLLFVVSGAYIDTQSYRYLVPLYAALAVAWAQGSEVLAKGRTSLAAAVVASIVGVHAWQQIWWYQRLTPDATSPALLQCLRDREVGGGYAEYWTAYKLTFLSNEELIVAPTSADRYPRYTDFVRSLPRAAYIGSAEDERGERIVCGETVIVIR